MRSIKQIIMVFSLLTIFAQTSQARSMAISVDPGELLTASIPVNFSFKTIERMSLGVSVSGKFFDFGGIGALSIAPGVFAKFHLTAPAFEDGWYIKPEFAVSYGKYGTGDRAIKSWGLEPSVVAGYDWVWDSGFMISLGLGVKYVHYFTDLSTLLKKDEYAFAFKGIMPTLDFQLGFAF